MGREFLHRSCVVSERVYFRKCSRVLEVDGPDRAVLNGVIHLISAAWTYFVEIVASPKQMKKYLFGELHWYRVKLVKRKASDCS